MGRRKKSGNPIKWARVYYNFPMRKRSSQLNDQLNKAGIFPDPVKAKPGLPKPFPSPRLSDTDDWCNYEECDSAARDAFDRGYGTALMTFFGWHIKFRSYDPLPCWILNALSLAFTLRMDARADSIDECIRLRLSRKRSKPKRQFVADFGQAIVDAVKDADKEHDVSINYELFRAIGNVYGKSGKTIQNVYRESKKSKN